jgi:hypothetical protein
MIRGGSNGSFGKASAEDDGDSSSDEEFDNVIDDQRLYATMYNGVNQIHTLMNNESQQLMKQPLGHGHQQRMAALGVSAPVSGPPAAAAAAPDAADAVAAGGNGHADRHADGMLNVPGTDT